MQQEFESGGYPSPGGLPVPRSHGPFCVHCGAEAVVLGRFCAACGFALPEVVAQGAAAIASPLEAARRLLVGGEHSEALRALEALRPVHPEHPLVHAYLGVAYLRAARIDDARAALDEAVRLGPESFTCQMAYGEFHARLGYFDRAVAAIDRALRAPTLSFEARQTALELRRLCSERTAGLYYRQVARPRLPRFFRKRRDNAVPAAVLDARSVAG